MPCSAQTCSRRLVNSPLLVGLFSDLSKAFVAPQFYNLWSAVASVILKISQARQNGLHSHCSSLCKREA
jgi:hypothetical protein